jgi:hypothetical protein
MPHVFFNLSIELTDRERVLVSRIDFNPQAAAHNADSWRPVADAMEEPLVIHGGAGKHTAYERGC